MLKLKEKIQKTTSISSFVALVLMLVGFILFDNFVNVIGLENDLLITSANLILLFLFFKLYIVFFSETNYSKKSEVNPREIVKQLKSEMKDGKVAYFSAEIAAILNAEVQLENSKHRKAVRRETAILYAIAFTISMKFILSGIGGLIDLFTK